MKKIVSALMLVGMVGAPAVVMAAEASPHTLTGNVSLTSDYIFRGISQTGGDAAIQGGMDYSHASGIYLGAWASNVGWIEDYQSYASGNIEIDLYGGYRGAIGSTGLTYDLGLIGYVYPGSRNGAVKADTTEAYAALGWKWFTLKYSRSLGKETFGFANSRGSDYLDIAASVPVGETGLTLGAHWGAFNFKNNSAQDYDDWKLSASYDMGKLGALGNGVTLGVMYTDTNAKKTAWTDTNNQYLGDGATTVWISKSF